MNVEKHEEGVADRTLIETLGKPVKKQRKTRAKNNLNRTNLNPAPTETFDGYYPAIEPKFTDDQIRKNPPVMKLDYKTVVEIKISYKIDTTKNLEIGIQRPLEPHETIHSAHKDLYVLCIKTLNDLLPKS